MIHLPTIAVLITCHNRKDKTIMCLSHLYFQKGLNENFQMEVFLVDDGSTDGTSEAIQVEFPDVNVIQGNGNLYWNRGMRLAWETAASSKELDYYLWLNDDTFLFEDALINLIDSARSKYNQTAIIGNTISDQKKVISYGGNTIDGKRIIPNGQLQEAYSFNGNVVLIPKFVFQIVGLLDKRYPHAIGDFDYGLRMRGFNLKSYVTKDFVGSCEENEKLPIWCCHSVSLKNRIKNLYSPLGNSHPYYYFLFERIHYGILTAIKHFLTIHLRLFFPRLWK